MQPHRIDGSMPPQRDFASENDIVGFIGKATLGIDLEELVLEDTRLQRKTGSLIQKSRRTMQRKLLAAAIAKLKKAARNKVWSAATGSALIAVAALEAYLCSKGETALKSTLAKMDAAIAQGFSKYNPLDMQASDQRAEAGVLQEKSREISESRSEIKEWLRSVKELEKRMLNCLDTLVQNEHRTALDTIGKIGA